MTNPKTRILLVEDESDIGRIIQLAMRTLGVPYELDLAMSAEEGLELWESGPYDLLLTDYNLRGMTGLDLIAHVRKSGHETATVLFTAYDTPAMRRDARDAGVAAYIPKPFFIDEFIDKVRGLLRQKVEELGGGTSFVP